MTRDLDQDILIVGGYGEVGRRLASLLEADHPGQVVTAGRHPEQASGGRTRRIDLDDPASIEAALDGVGLVVACARQREPHLLHAVVRRGLAYTSIAPPWMPWPAVQALDAKARRSGARVVLPASSRASRAYSRALARIVSARSRRSRRRSC